jgi:hypothetical protein
VRQFGIDIPVHGYADATGKMTVDEFIALPASALTTAQRIPSFGYSSKSLLAQSFVTGGRTSAGAALAAARPSFIDHFSVFYRPSAGGPWTQKEFGDRSSARDSDLDYRESVLILPPPPAATGYEWCSASEQQHPDAAGDALLAAGVSPVRDPGYRILELLFWPGGDCQRHRPVACRFIAPPPAVGICLFSLNYPLVAALHGYPEWFFGNAVLRCRMR